jgi:PBP1b-binding outer membrane lipoprotein LpoB
MTSRLIIISLLFLILSGCSKGNAGGHIETDFKQVSSTNATANIQKIQTSSFEVRK